MCMQHENLSEVGCTVVFRSLKDLEDAKLVASGDLALNVQQYKTIKGFAIGSWILYW